MKYLKIRIPGQIIQIPYLRIKGKKGDQRCVISGGIHGDEVNGIALVREFIDYCRKKKIEEHLRGELIILPILNESGFKDHVRTVAYDGKDLNRCFNRKTRTASNLIANALERNFYKKADIAIDCHDSGKRAILIPHARVHKFESKYCTECTREMAQALGTKIIVERKGKGGMLAVEMMKKHNLPVLTIEVGGAMKVSHKFIKDSFEGIINILKHTRMLPGNPKIPQKQYYLHNRFGIAAKESGLLKFDKRLGQRVHSGDKIGEIYVPAKAKVVDLIAPTCGLLFSMQHVDLVTDGEIMYSILEDKKCHVRRRTVKHFEEIKNIRME
jgi:uncharacterized protein